VNAERRVTLVGVAVLVAVLAVAAAGAILLLGHEADQRRAVAFAAAVTGSGAVTGWLMARQGRGGTPAAAVAGGLAATLARMVPMLGALGWLVDRNQAAWEHAAAGLLVAFHVILLVTDMVLHSVVGRRSGRAPAAPENRG